MNKKQFKNQLGKINRNLNHLLCIYQDHHINDLEYDPRVENMLKTILFTNDNLIQYIQESDQ